MNRPQSSRSLVATREGDLPRPDGSGLTTFSSMLRKNGKHQPLRPCSLPSHQELASGTLSNDKASTSNERTGDKLVHLVSRVRRKSIGQPGNYSNTSVRLGRWI